MSHEIVSLLDSDEESCAVVISREQGVASVPRVSLDPRHNSYSNSSNDSRRKKKKPIKSNDKPQKNGANVCDLTLFDSDSDSDESIFNFAGFPTKKKIAIPTDSSCKKSTRNSMTLETPKAAPKAIVNPYARKKLNSATRRTPVVNPYARKPSPAAIATPMVSQEIPVESASRKPSTSAAEAAVTTTTTPGNSMETLIPNLSTADSPVGHCNSSMTSGSSRTVSTIANTVEYPRLNPSAQQYPDLRPALALAFWKYARSLTTKSYNGEALHVAVRRISQIALSPYPIRSIDEYCHGLSKASAIAQMDRRKQDLLNNLEQGGFDGLVRSIQVGDNQHCLYYSIAEACLVAMATEIDRRIQRHGYTMADALLTEKTMYISLQFLIPEVQKRMHPACPKIWREKDADGGVAYYLDKSTRSAEFIQIEKLQNQKDPTLCYIKRRKQKGECVFELTPLGYKMAKVVQERTYPAPSGHYRTSRIKESPAQFQGICLVVDRREGGLKNMVLHRMCSRLDSCGSLPFLVSNLTIGDYAFVCNEPGPNFGRLCPVLVERKSIEDVAQSINDGRWTKQKHRMYHGQFVFGYENSRIFYIIEGKEEKEQVSGGYIGSRWLNVSRERLDGAIENLKEEGFEVLRSSSELKTMFDLAALAKSVAQDIRSSKLRLQYTYQEFQAEVKKIPAATDFSRLAKDYMQTKLEREKQLSDLTTNEKKATGNMSPGVDRKTDAAASPRATFQSSEQDCVEILSDSDEEIVDKKERHEVIASARRKHEKPEAKACGPKSSLTDGGSSSALAKAVRSKPRFKPSAEVAKYFGVDSSSEDSESDDELMAKVKRTVKKHKKRKRKRKEMEERKQAKALQENKKQRTNKLSTTGACATTHRRKSGEEGGGQRVTDGNQGNEAANANNYEEWTAAELKRECARLHLKKTGTKPELIKTLNGPRRPQSWIERDKLKQYVPDRPNIASVAILVALLFHFEQTGDVEGLTEDEIMYKAEQLDIKKDSMAGGTTQVGPYLYTGFASMKQLLTKGDPALVEKRQLGGENRYRLTRNGPLTGFNFARDCHSWIHQYADCKCKCKELGFC